MHWLAGREELFLAELMFESRTRVPKVHHDLFLIVPVMSREQNEVVRLYRNVAVGHKQPASHEKTKCRLRAHVSFEVPRWSKACSEWGIRAIDFLSTAPAQQNGGAPNHSTAFEQVLCVRWKWRHFKRVWSLANVFATKHGKDKQAKRKKNAYFHAACNSQAGYTGRHTRCVHTLLFYYSSIRRLRVFAFINMHACICFTSYENYGLRGGKKLRGPATFFGSFDSRYEWIMKVPLFIYLFIYLFIRTFVRTLFVHYLLPAVHTLFWH